MTPRRAHLIAGVAWGLPLALLVAYAALGVALAMAWVWVDPAAMDQTRPWSYGVAAAAGIAALAGVVAVTLAMGDDSAHRLGWVVARRRGWHLIAAGVAVNLLLLGAAGLGVGHRDRVQAAEVTVAHLKDAMQHVVSVTATHPVGAAGIRVAVTTDGLRTGPHTLTWRVREPRSGATLVEQAAQVTVDRRGWADARVLDATPVIARFQHVVLGGAPATRVEQLVLVEAVIAPVLADAERAALAAAFQPPEELSDHGVALYTVRFVVDGEVPRLLD